MELFSSCSWLNTSDFSFKKQAKVNMVRFFFSSLSLVSLLLGKNNTNHDNNIDNKTDSNKKNNSNNNKTAKKRKVQHECVVSLGF